jgi:hypothetical protein
MLLQEDITSSSERTWRKKSEKSDNNEKTMTLMAISLLALRKLLGKLYTRILKPVFSEKNYHEAVSRMYYVFAVVERCIKLK